MSDPSTDLIGFKARLDELEVRWQSLQQRRTQWLDQRAWLERQFISFPFRLEGADYLRANLDLIYQWAWELEQQRSDARSKALTAVVDLERSLILGTPRINIRSVAMCTDALASVTDQFERVCNDYDHAILAYGTTARNLGLQTKVVWILAIAAPGCGGLTAIAIIILLLWLAQH